MTVLLALPFLLKNEKKEYKRTRNIIVKIKRKILKFGMLKQNYLIFAFIGCTFLSES